VADASIAVGDEVRVFPSGAIAIVAALNTPRGATVEARAGEAVAIALDRQVDVARGDWIIASTRAAPASHMAEHGAQMAQHGAQTAQHGSHMATATLAWLDAVPLVVGRRLLARHGTRWLPVRVAQVRKRLDLNTATWIPEHSDAGTSSTGANDIIEATIEFASSLPLIAYGSSKARGAILLVDPGTHATSAAGLVREVH
jgi:sulfate adenylyltransferase subunit 1